jgi:hypothetical protein
MGRPVGMKRLPEETLHNKPAICGTAD